MKKETMKIIYISTGFLVAILMILSGLVVYKYAQPDKVQAATSTYTETWTATSGIHATGYYSGVYTNGLGVGSSCVGYPGAPYGYVSCMVTITGWSVSGTVNLP